jgi:hypothetical protein
MIAPTVTDWKTTKILGSRQIDTYSPECVQEFSANRACLEFCEVCLTACCDEDGLHGIMD